MPAMSPDAKPARTIRAYNRHCSFNRHAGKRNENATPQRDAVTKAIMAGLRRVRLARTAAAVPDDTPAYGYQPEPQPAAPRTLGTFVFERDLEAV